MKALDFRMLAVQLAAQLPGDKSSAREVVKNLSDLVENWIYAEPAAKPSLELISCKAEASRTGSPETSPR